MTAALADLIERVLALPECAGESALLLRAYLDGERSPSLVEEMRPALHPDQTCAELAICVARLAVLHELHGDVVGQAEALALLGDTLRCADEVNGPPSLRCPPSSENVLARDDDRQTDPCEAPAMEGAE